MTIVDKQGEVHIYTLQLYILQLNCSSKYDLYKAQLLPLHQIIFSLNIMGIFYQFTYLASCKVARERLQCGVLQRGIDFKHDMFIYICQKPQAFPNFNQSTFAGQT